MDDLIVLLKVLDLLHDLFENFGAVLWRIAVFYKADLDLQLQLIADVLIVQPVSKRRFGVDNLFDLLRQSLALVVDDSTPSTSLSVPYSKSYWSRRARRIKIKKGIFLFNYSHYYLVELFFSSLEKPVCDRNKWTCPYKAMKNRQSIYAQS